MRFHRLALTLAALVLAASCARRAPEAAWRPVPRPAATAGAPEVRAFCLVEPLSAREADALFARVAAAGFNALYIEAPTPPASDQASPFTEAIASLAHRHGLDVLVRIFPSLPAGGGVREAMERAASSLAGAVSRELVDAIIVEPPLGAEVAASPEAVFGPLAPLSPVRLGAIFYPTLAVETSHDGPPGAAAWSREHLAWARERRIDLLVVYPHFGPLEDNLRATGRSIPAHFPALVQVGAGSRGADAAEVAAQIRSIRRHPAEGVIVLGEADPAFLDTLRAEVFAEPAFPPSRDWHAAMESAVSRAASAEDVPELVRGGLGSLQRALREGDPTDLQVHQVLDLLLQVGTPRTMCERHLEMALMCLRQSQREQLDR